LQYAFCSTDILSLVSLVGAFSASNQACCADFSLAPIPPKEALGEADSMDFSCSWQSALCAGGQGAGWAGNMVENDTVFEGKSSTHGF